MQLPPTLDEVTYSSSRHLSNVLTQKVTVLYPSQVQLTISPGYLPEPLTVFPFQVGISIQVISAGSNVIVHLNNTGTKYNGNTTCSGKFTTT